MGLQDERLAAPSRRPRDLHKIVTTWPLPPTFSECELILRARARFHAHWWEDFRLGKSIGSWGDAKAVDGFLQRLEGKVAEFASGSAIACRQREGSFTNCCSIARRAL